ncbi:VOC family protein [Actinoplanes sp. NPDC026619]
MLRKIDCVMVRVADLDAGVAFYTDRLGLTELWRDDTASST